MADAGAEVLSAGMERWCVAMEKEALRMFHKLFSRLFCRAVLAVRWRVALTR